MSQDIPHINSVLEPVNAYIEHTKLADRDFSHAFGELIGSFVTALDRLREKSYLVYDVRDQLQANIEDYGRIVSDKIREDVVKSLPVANPEEEATPSEVKLEIFPVTEKNEKISGSSDSQSEMIESLNAKIAELTKDLKMKETVLCQTRTHVVEKNTRVLELEDSIRDNKKHIDELHQTIEEKDICIRDLQKKYDDLVAVFHVVKASIIRKHRINDSHFGKIDIIVQEEVVEEEAIEEKESDEEEAVEKSESEDTEAVEEEVDEEEPEVEEEGQQEQEEQQEDEEEEEPEVEEEEED